MFCLTNLILIANFLFISSFNDLPSVNAVIPDKKDYSYSDDLKDYKNGEIWGWHSMPLGTGVASSALGATKNLSYDVNNLSDFDLNTAWIEGRGDYGIGETIEFEIFDDTLSNAKTRFNGFCGELEMFNGYCKSLELWKNNSRVKQLKAFFNDTPICLINLNDTWRIQHIDLSQYIIQNMEKENSFTLKFEITEVYKGDKYKDVAVSELLGIPSPS